MTSPGTPADPGKAGLRFVVAHLNEKAQKRFVLKKRVVFAVYNILALIAMWITQKMSPDMVPWWYTTMGFCAWMIFWSIGAWVRPHHTQANISLMLMGWIALGMTAGFAAAPGNRFDSWTATCVVGFAMIGSIVDSICFHARHSPGFHFSHNGVWILAGGILTYLFPGTEWSLAFSGIFAILVTFLLNATQNHVFNTFCHTEYVAAASNIPTIFLFRNQ